jgi:hypothetical protein
LPTKTDPVEVVYVIGSPSSRLVKIGRTKNLKKRFGDIQRMSPAPLEVLWSTPGGHKLEQALHERFRTQRSHGEWFDFGTTDAVKAVAQAVDELQPPVRRTAPQRRAPKESLVQPTAAALEALAVYEWDPSDPYYEPDCNGCRVMTPPELVADGYMPDAQVMLCSPEMTTAAGHTH